MQWPASRSWLSLIIYVLCLIILLLSGQTYACDMILTCDIMIIIYDYLCEFDNLYNIRYLKYTCTPHSFLSSSFQVFITIWAKGSKFGVRHILPGVTLNDRQFLLLSKGKWLGVKVAPATEFIFLHCEIILVVLPILSLSFLWEFDFILG